MKVDGDTVVFTDEDFWNLDQTLAKVIAPALAQFQHRIDGCPNDFVDDDDPMAIEGMKRWKEALRKMHDAFEFIASDEIVGSYEHDMEVQEGVELFGRYFQALWT